MLRNRDSLTKTLGQEEYN
jgi:ABC-type multidrug transport system fused ATPase/permease subunit